jgi:hypothetical protein
MGLLRTSIVLLTVILLGMGNLLAAMVAAARFLNCDDVSTTIKPTSLSMLPPYFLRGLVGGMVPSPSMLSRGRSVVSNTFYNSGVNIRPTSGAGMTVAFADETASADPVAPSREGSSAAFFPRKRYAGLSSFSELQRALLVKAFPGRRLAGPCSFSEVGRALLVLASAHAPNPFA